MLAWLRTPEAVRERCHALLALAEQDALAHFAFDAARLDDAADYTATVIRENYPDLAIPYHARWRHFAAGGIDRWGALAARLRGYDRDGDRAAAHRPLHGQRAAGCRRRHCLDLPRARNRPGARRDPKGSPSPACMPSAPACSRLTLDSRSAPTPMDLSRLSDAALAEAFQVSPDNPLAGVAGRAALLRRLGAALRSRPDLAGADARIGGLLDLWRSRMSVGALAARELLAAILEMLAPIWPGRLALAGENLGDVWSSPDRWPRAVPQTVAMAELFDGGGAGAGIDRGRRSR